MKPPSLDALRTPANGQIFALKKALSKAAVRSAFESASANASGRTLGKTIREKRTVNATEFWASFVCSPSSRRPPFLPETDLAEHTYGFLLLLELQVKGEWFVGIFKHGTASLADWLDARAKPLPRVKFTNAFSGESSVRKMSLQRMAASKHELRAATYEAPDLQSSLPMIAASRCVIRAIRFQGTDFGSIALTVSTSRIQRSGGRCPVGDLASLVSLVAVQTQADKPNAFLATFAQAVAISDLPPGTEPTSILFDWNEIIENDPLELYRKPAPGEGLKKPVPKKLLQRLLGDTLQIVADGEEWEFIKNVHRPLGRLSVTSTKYSLKSILGNQLVVYNANGGETVSLARWTRENDAYSITFTRSEFFFGGGALYQRAHLEHEVDVIRRCLQVEGALAGATSEKGDPKKGALRFPANSIFGVAEDSIYARNDWLCCLDLGDEWADYLCIKNNTLLLIHCKSGKRTSGATSFQEVVGQGLKNLGRIQSTPQVFQKKLAATENLKVWSKTRIKRLRNPGGKWRDFQAAVSDVLANPNAAREVHLVLTMLSKADFEISAAALEPHFIQLIWLLASFANTCREMGARPVIVCTP
jgi:hypothetical protein